MAAVEQDESPGGIKDIDDASIDGIDMPHRCRQNRRNSLRISKIQHPGRVIARTARAIGATMADDLHDEPVAW